MSIHEKLEQGLAELSVPLAAGRIETLAKYCTLLLKWNRIYNLTAIRQPSKLVSHHLLDSLVVAPLLKGTRIVDVGTGPGLPGIPLALAHPEWQVTLVDSNHKKGAFLRQVVVELGIANVDVQTTRVENWRPVIPYDIAVSRAFSDLAGFVDAARHLVTENGRLAAMKGVYPHEELAHLPAGITVESVTPLTVPGLNAARHLVLLRPIAPGAA